MKVLRANADGTSEEVDVSPEELEQAHASQPLHDDHGPALSEDEDDILSLVAPQRDQTVVEKTVHIVLPASGEDGEDETVARPVFIQRLSRRETERLDQMRWRNVNGRITLNPDAETTILANLLHLCVVRNIARPGLKPVYSPRWTMAQIQGTPAKTNRKNEVIEDAKPGLLDARDAATEQLLNQLQSHIWSVNPSFDPFQTAQAVQLMGTS